MSLTGKPALTTAAAVTNDGFWPDLTLADLMNNYRIPSEYADGVIKTGLNMALINVNLKLASVKAQLVLDGYVSLAAYTTAHPEALNGKQVLEELYKHAVYARAKAGLLMQFAAINRRPQAENQAKEGDDMETHWLDESQAAIAEFFRRFLPAETVFSKANTLAVLI
ncbi:head completion/stabilization protein [Methylobacter sp. Wu8]|uniref:head completion/stabilization protein n=1 Tax=Methylobacter sp. Wu8 TaxID=3118457 RepID=UPI002F2DFDCC